MDARKLIYRKKVTVFTLSCTSNSAHSGSFSNYLEIPFLRGADMFSQRVAHWLELVLHVALRWALCPGILGARIVHRRFFGFFGGEVRKREGQ